MTTKSPGYIRELVPTPFQSEHSQKCPTYSTTWSISVSMSLVTSSSSCTKQYFSVLFLCFLFFSFSEFSLSVKYTTLELTSNLDKSQTLFSSASASSKFNSLPNYGNCFLVISKVYSFGYILLATAISQALKILCLNGIIGLLTDLSVFTKT